MKRTPLRSVSRSRVLQLREYSKLRASWLDGKTCSMCGVPATEVHHSNGRTGQRLLRVWDWVAVCREHHRWIHDNPEVAKSLGALKLRKDFA